MAGYRCRTCGVWHDERPTCFLIALPLFVEQIPEAERAARVEQASDQCVVDNEHFFIIGNLDVPIRGSREFLRWTVWSSLSAKNYLRSCDLWNTPGRESEPPYFGWLNNQIPGYSSTVNIEALVHTQSVGIRPRIEVIAEGHALRTDQQDGISEERADELIHAALHAGGS